MAAKLRAHFLYLTSTPTTQLSKNSTEKDTRLVFSPSQTGTTLVTGARGATTTGWERWPAPDLSQRDLQTSQIPPSLESGPHTSGLEGIPSLKGCPTNSSS